MWHSKIKQNKTNKQTKKDHSWFRMSHQYESIKVHQMQDWEPDPSSFLFDLLILLFLLLAFSWSESVNQSITCLGQWKRKDTCKPHLTCQVLSLINSGLINSGSTRIVVSISEVLKVCEVTLKCEHSFYVIRVI